MFTKKLVPKEEKYFSDFKEMISLVHELGKFVNELFAAQVPDAALLLKIKPLEARCEEVSEKVIKRLNKTFITPFDREDIFALIKRLNSINKMLVNAAVRIDTFNIKKKIRHADQLSGIVLQQITQLDISIQELKTKRINEFKTVRDLETEASKIYQQAIRELFSTEPDPVELIKQKEVLDYLENASDRCQSVGNVIHSIFIKNA